MRHLTLVILMALSAIVGTVAFAANLTRLSEQRCRQTVTHPRSRSEGARCDNCHEDSVGASESVSHGRDPLFNAALAVTAQDVVGAKRTCLRCHAAAGWRGRRPAMTGVFNREKRSCNQCHDGVADVDGLLFSARHSVGTTHSEFAAGEWSRTKVTELPKAIGGNLPLKGAVKTMWERAEALSKADRPNGVSSRNVMCKDCHVRKSTKRGSGKKVTTAVGGNFWMPSVMQYLDSQKSRRKHNRKARWQRANLENRCTHAMQQLKQAAALQIDGNVLTIWNLTAHKLPTGFVAGRRMWVNTTWYDEDGELIREDGAYELFEVVLEGVPMVVASLVDPADSCSTIFEARLGITATHAVALIDAGVAPDMPLSFDRQTGRVEMTLGELAAGHGEQVQETFHLAINNVVTIDNRIPPFGMRRDVASARNTQPVPSDQYGAPAAGEAYQHFATVDLSPPQGASRAKIRLMYQPTSWEYVQFLYLADKMTAAIPEHPGNALLFTWLETGMAEPYVMAETEWRKPTDRSLIAVLEKAHRRH